MVWLLFPPFNKNYKDDLTMNGIGPASNLILYLIFYKVKANWKDFYISRFPSTGSVYFIFFCSVAAKDKAFLRRMGITYVLNTAEGKRYTQVDTDHLYYRDCPNIRYKGFPMMDMPSTDISRYFYTAANFIEEGLSRGGKYTTCHSKSKLNVA